MKLVTLLFGLFISVSGCNASDYEKVQLFSKEVLQVISNGDREAFKQLPITAGNTISEEAVSYLLGGNGELGVTGFLSSSDKVKIKIYGPYGIGDARYSVVYYDSLRLSPNENGLFNMADIQQAWGVSYLETIVIVVDDKVNIYRTPFYYGSHAPWEADH